MASHIIHIKPHNSPDDLFWSASIERKFCGSSWTSIDVLFVRDPHKNEKYLPEGLASEDIFLDGTPLTTQSVGSTSALKCLRQCLSATVISGDRESTLLKFILPKSSGQIVRADIIPLRLADQEYVESVFSFSRPRQQYSLAEPIDHHLKAIFTAAVAGIIVAQESLTESSELSTAIDLELENRLSFPWMINPPLPVQTLVIVEGGHVHPGNGGYATSVYMSAKALGLDVVVLDNAGHWLDGPEYAHWRAEFVPIDLPDEPDSGLVSRIVAAIQTCGRKIDGLMTLCEWYKPHVAQACQELGLPSDPPKAYEIATDKYQTSRLAGHSAHLCHSVHDAKRALNSKDMQFPLIIKPCKGWSSEGVARIDCPEDLEVALSFMDTSRHGAEFILEPYCNGPEVDVNVILWGGEIIFFDICDDTPKPADGLQSTRSQSFHEQDSVYPSILPSTEIEVLRSSCQNALQAMGFENGVFHTEYRVADSSVEYRPIDGLVDLVPRTQTTSNGAGVKHAQAWLHEINPRPPGMTASKISESTYGIDYWGLSLLMPLGDEARIRALSQPFINGAQYSSVMVFIGNEYDRTRYEGIFYSDDICAELLGRRPHLAKNISNCACFIKRGEKVAHPATGENIFIAYFNVFSRNGRAEALRLAAEVRRELRVAWK